MMRLGTSGPAARTGDDPASNFVRTNPGDQTVSERGGQEWRRTDNSSMGSAYGRVIEPFPLIPAPGASRRGRVVGQRCAGTPGFGGAVSAVDFHRLAISAADRRTKRRHVQKALRRERNV